MLLARLNAGGNRSGSPARGHSGLVCFLLTILLAIAGPVQADDALLQRMTPVINEAFFHVAVTGTPAGNEFQPARHGKGFGIAPNLLITSRHVVGEPQEWANATNGRAEVARAVRPILREIALRRPADGDEVETETFVQPAPTYAIDATGIVAPGIEMKEYFQLSLCKIAAGGTYWALLTMAAEPTSQDSAEEVDLIRLRAVDFDPAQYGPLYVFDIVSDTRFARNNEGHDGSPILDGEGNVVAVVSALTTEGQGHRILATPTQPLFPGATGMLALAVDDQRAAEGSLKCSLADTVRDLHEKVSSHVIWDVHVERDERDGRIKEVYFKYETISREPNIASIDVLVNYFGESMPALFAEEQSRPVRIDISLPNNGILNIDETAEGDARKFVTREIGKMGRQLVEPFVAERAEEKGRIDYVEVQIIPNFKSRRQGRKSVFEFPYVSPSFSRDQ